MSGSLGIGTTTTNILIRTSGSPLVGTRDTRKIAQVVIKLAYTTVLQPRCYSEKTAK